MSKKTYNKIPLSYNEQIVLLKNRGLTINDEPKALNYLKEISYYRLSAYFLPYQQVKDKFNSEVTFKQIINTYLLSFTRLFLVFLFNIIQK